MEFKDGRGFGRNAPREYVAPEDRATRKKAREVRLAKLPEHGITAVRERAHKDVLRPRRFSWETET